ncbi:MAG: hypothetical protein BGO98_33530 [Myxococcales bacterium 68-20]|nr:MAG: hypothetical protein BGO98_33530 [Myxococcales bacterium 68-20]
MRGPDRSRATRSASRVPGTGESLRRTGRIALLIGVSTLGSFAPLASVAHAADWPMVQGTEPPNAPPIRPFGVVQVTGSGIIAEPVFGLSPVLAQFEGERASFNTLSPRGATWGIVVRRARPGVRGVIPGTGGLVSYYLVAELGTVPLARDGPTLADASITISWIPGARIRVGQFRLPLMDEAVESNASAAEWINVSLPASGLVMENPVRNGRYDGGASGFRDLGVAVFDTHQRGHMALSYALMVSNGRRGALDDDAKDLTARTMASWVFSGEATDPQRQELSIFAWGQRGKRNVDGVSAQRIRSGVGIHLEKEPIRIRAELVYASGVIFGGPSPPFAGQPIEVDTFGRGIGGYVQARVRLFGNARVGARYDELRRGLDEPSATRVSRSFTPMLEYDIVPRVRLQATYEKRWLFAPSATRDTKTIARSMGDRVDAQVTVSF